MPEQLLELADRPIDTDLYTPYIQYGTPLLIYGVTINNMYDHERLCINSKLSPKRLRVGKKHLYGTILQPSRLMDRVCSVLSGLPMEHVDVVNMYKKRIKMYGLSCDTCWLHLDENIFPLDVSNLHRVTINSEYIKMIDNAIQLTEHDTMPWFSQHADMKIFLVK